MESWLLASFLPFHSRSGGQGDWGQPSNSRSAGRDPLVIVPVDPALRRLPDCSFAVPPRRHHPVVLGGSSWEVS